MRLLPPELQGSPDSQGALEDAGVAWQVPPGQQWEQGRVLPQQIYPSVLQEGTGKSWELLMCPDPHPRVFHPPHPQQGGSQGWARLPAQGQPSWVPPSSFPPEADGSDTAPYHPYFIFSRVFLACPTLTGEALYREQALLWPGLAGEIKQQPQPHCVPLSVAHFHLLCSHEQLHGLCWVYLQWRERG